MEKPKINQIFTGVLILWVGILFLCIMLSLTLIPTKGVSHLFGGTGSFNNFLPGNTSACIFITLFLIFYIEAALWWTRQSIQIDESKLEYKENSLWTAIALFFQYAGIAYSAFGSLIILGITCLFAYIIMAQFRYNPLTVSNQFFIMAGIFVLYIAARKPLFSLFKKSGASRKLGGGQPTYTLTGKGLTIDLNMRNLKDPAKRLVTLGFDEIEEIRTFSYVEAQTFFKYEIGPNLELTIRQVTDLRDYIKGKISRPTVYTFGAPQSMGTNVLLKGLDLLYFFTFNKPDASDLVDAFNKFKASGGHVEPLPEKKAPAAAAATAPAAVEPAVKSKFCPNCGDPIKEGEKFCDKCGKKLV